LPDADGVDYDPAVNAASLFTDAYNQVFFSIGVCVGVMYAYGSYNHIKKPVIMDAVVICVMDFVFAILAGFITWGCIGYLQAVGNPAYN
jgi:SNF family Na+-dependent transporter